MKKAIEFLQRGNFGLHDSEVPYIDFPTNTYDGDMRPILDALRIAYLEGALEWMSPYDTGCGKECRAFLEEFKQLTGEDYPDSPLY